MDMETKMTKLLMEIGFLASGLGMTAKADTIFDAAMVLKPKAENAWVGKAVNRMNAGSPEEAVDLLREKALSVNPDSDAAQNFLGLALKLAGRASEAETVLARVAAQSKEKEAVAMARNLLAEIRG